MPRYYFAYGSNMWREQMLRRCPQSEEIGRAMLSGYRWIITTRGYASVVKAEGETVEGVLFRLNEEDERAMDGFEQVARNHYYKAYLPVTMTADGATVEALVYIDPIAEEGPPKAEYVQRVENGLKDAGLSPEYALRLRDLLHRP